MNSWKCPSPPPTRPFLFLLGWVSDLCQVVTEHLEDRLIVSPYLCGSGSREMKEIEYKRQLNVFDCVAQRVTPKAMKQKKKTETPAATTGSCRGNGEELGLKHEPGRSYKPMTTRDGPELVSETARARGSVACRTITPRARDDSPGQYVCV